MVRRTAEQVLPIELAILDAGTQLQVQDGSFYGFLLARHMADVDEAPLLAHGTLYKALARMTKAGLLEASWEDPAIAESEGRPRRKFYQVTGAGAQARAREHHRLHQVQTSAVAFGLGPA